MSRVTTPPRRPAARWGDHVQDHECPIKPDLDGIQTFIGGIDVKVEGLATEQIRMRDKIHDLAGEMHELQGSLLDLQKVSHRLDKLEEWREKHQLENAKVLGGIESKFDRIEEKMDKFISQAVTNKEVLLGTDRSGGRDGLVRKVDDVTEKWATFEKSAQVQKESAAALKKLVIGALIAFVLNILVKFIPQGWHP